MPHDRSVGELHNVLGAGPSRATLLAQRPRVIAAMRAAALADRRRPIVLGGLALAAATVAVLSVLAWTGQAPKLTAAHDGHEVAELGVVRGSRVDGALLGFSDGSQVRLAKDAEVRLARLDPSRVDLALTKGSIHARVAAGTGRAWAVLAGPYRVQLVGTEFSVVWSSATGEIEVSVMAGRALVFGFELPPDGLAVESGSHFARRDIPAPTTSPPRSAQQGSAGLDSAAAPTPVLEQAGPAPSRTKASSAARPEAADQGQDWKALASSQRYSDALAAARETGIDQLLASLGAVDLLLLANTARYAGDVAQARLTLHELRARFPRSPSATLAALVLAGIEERAKNPREAARWLRTFLAESPDGELSAGARARLLSILVRSGQTSEARRVAADYLRHHPSGPYASEARGVLDSVRDP